MTSKVLGNSDRISLDFYWKGPNVQKEDGLNVEVVDLAFKGAQSAISVRLPENFNPVGLAKMRFVCCRQEKTELSDSLSVTIEQIRNLTIKARVSETTDSNVGLEIPMELEVGQKYNLVVNSENLSLSACLVEEQTDTAVKMQAVKMQLILKTFGETEEPTEKAINRALDAFKTLPVSKKLTAIQGLLLNENCTPAVARRFIYQLDRPVLAQLKERIAKEYDEDSNYAERILQKKCKSNIVQDAVAACLAKVQNQADKSKIMLIRKTYDGRGEYPNTQARQAALEAFQGLESQKSQLVILSELLDSNHITNAHVTQFAEALPKGTAMTVGEADDSDEEEVRSDKMSLQGRLLALVKEERQVIEETATARYKEVMELIRAYKKTHSLPRDPNTGEPIALPNKPHAFNNLKDYFNVRSSDYHIRQTLKDQTRALLNQIQEEQT